MEALRRIRTGLLEAGPLEFALTAEQRRLGTHCERRFCHKSRLAAHEDANCGEHVQARITVARMSR